MYNGVQFVSEHFWAFGGLGWVMVYMQRTFDELVSEE